MTTDLVMLDAVELEERNAHQSAEDELEDDMLRGRSENGRGEWPGRMRKDDYLAGRKRMIRKSVRDGGASWQGRSVPRSWPDLWRKHSRCWLLSIK